LVRQTSPQHSPQEAFLHSSSSVNALDSVVGAVIEKAISPITMTMMAKRLTKIVFMFSTSISLELNVSEQKFTEQYHLKASIIHFGESDLQNSLN